METKTAEKTMPEIVVGTPSEDYRNLVEAKQATAINQSAETVAIALEKFVDDGRITAHDKGLVLWFFGHCKDRRLSLSEAGKEIHYNAATVSRLFRGNYEGSLDNVVKAIRSYKQIIDERAMEWIRELYDVSGYGRCQLWPGSAILQCRKYVRGGQKNKETIR